MKSSLQFFRFFCYIFTLFNLLIFKLNSHINILLFFLALLIIFIVIFSKKKFHYKEYQIKYFSNIVLIEKIIFIELMRNTIIFLHIFIL